MGRVKMIPEEITASLKGKGFNPVPRMAYIFGCNKQTMYVFVRNNKHLFEESTETKTAVFGDGNKKEKVKTYKVKENEAEKS